MNIGLKWVKQNISQQTLTVYFENVLLLLNNFPLFPRLGNCMPVLWEWFN